MWTQMRPLAQKAHYMHMNVNKLLRRGFGLAAPGIYDYDLYAETNNEPSYTLNHPLRKKDEMTELHSKRSSFKKANDFSSFKEYLTSWSERRRIEVGYTRDDGSCIDQEWEYDEYCSEHASGITDCVLTQLHEHDPDDKKCNDFTQIIIPHIHQSVVGFHSGVYKHKLLFGNDEYKELTPPYDINKYSNDANKMYLDFCLKYINANWHGYNKRDDEYICTLYDKLRNCDDKYKHIACIIDYILQWTLKCAQCTLDHAIYDVRFKNLAQFRASMRILTMDILEDWRYEIDKSYHTKINCMECKENDDYNLKKDLYHLSMVGLPFDCSECGPTQQDKDWRIEDADLDKDDPMEVMGKLMNSLHGQTFIAKTDKDKDSKESNAKTI